MPFDLNGRTYAYSVALRVIRDLQAAYASEGYTFHNSPDSDGVFSRIAVYGPAEDSADAAGVFLGYY